LWGGKVSLTGNVERQQRERLRKWSLSLYRSFVRLSWMKPLWDTERYVKIFWGRTSLSMGGSF
jgi:hypothetical protein